jgi:hypothetical protein
VPPRLPVTGEARGATLANCPGYVREWIDRNQQWATQKEDIVTATQQRSEQAVATTAAIRPFRVNVPEAELADMRRRIKATRLPEKELVSDFSQGVQLAVIQRSRGIGRPITTGGGARRN